MHSAVLPTVTVLYLHCLLFLLLHLCSIIISKLYFPISLPFLNSVSVFLTALTIMAFVTSQERIGLVLTCLVSMFFFLKMVAERTPTSDTVPLLSIYYVMLCLEVTLIFYAVCITLNAYHRDPALSAMSTGVRWLVVKKLGHMWGKDSINDEIKQKLESLQAISNMAKNKYQNCEELRTTDCSVNVNHSSLYDEQSREVELANSVEETGFGVNEFEREDSYIRSTDRQSEGFVREDFSSCSQSRIRHREDQFSTNKAGINIGERSCDEGCSTFVDESHDFPRRSSYKQRNTQAIKPSDYHMCELCKTKYTTSSCSSFLNEMITLNQRLILDIQEINYLARKWDHTSSQKEHWCIAASILDKSFFILFVMMFVVLTLSNFIW